MQYKTINFTYEEYESFNELGQEEQNLLSQALKTLNLSYSPYSNFKVSAAAILDTGEIITGSNQENASYAATICAERTLLSILSSLPTNPKIKTLLICFQSENSNFIDPITPCGICRQSLLEQELKQDTPIKTILIGSSGKTWVIHSINDILPLAFNKHNLK